MNGDNREWLLLSLFREMEARLVWAPISLMQQTWSCELEHNDLIGEYAVFISN